MNLCLMSPSLILCSWLQLTYFFLYSLLIHIFQNIESSNIINSFRSLLFKETFFMVPIRLLPIKKSRLEKRCFINKYQNLFWLNVGTNFITIISAYFKTNNWWGDTCSSIPIYKGRVCFFVRSKFESRLIIWKNNSLL